jgi:uncharacterized protein YdgA (DUF945 family)
MVTTAVALGLATLAVAIGGTAYSAVSASDRYEEQKKANEAALAAHLANENILTEAEKRKKELEINLLEREVFNPGPTVPNQATTTPAASQFSLPSPDTVILYGGSALLLWMAYKVVKK